MRRKLRTCIYSDVPMIGGVFDDWHNLRLRFLYRYPRVCPARDLFRSLSFSLSLHRHSPSWVTVLPPRSFRLSSLTTNALVDIVTRCVDSHLYVRVYHTQSTGYYITSFTDVTSVTWKNYAIIIMLLYIRDGVLIKMIHLKIKTWCREIKI